MTPQIKSQILIERTYPTDTGLWLVMECDKTATLSHDLSTLASSEWAEDGRIVVMKRGDKMVSGVVKKNQEEILAELQVTGTDLDSWIDQLIAFRDFLKDKSLYHTPKSTLLEERDGGAYYVGPLQPAKALAAADRFVREAVNEVGYHQVFLHDTEEDRDAAGDDYAEFGSGETNEEAWRYAIGAAFGPLDTEYREHSLINALWRYVK